MRLIYFERFYPASGESHPVAINPEQILVIRPINEELTSIDFEPSWTVCVKGSFDYVTSLIEAVARGDEQEKELKQ